MYEHVLSSSIYRKHSTARHNQPCTKQRQYVPTRARQRNQQDRISESYHVAEHLHSLLCSQNKQIEIFPEKCRTTHKTADEAGVMREGLALMSSLNKIQHCFFSPFFLCIPYMHAASGLFSWSMELLNLCKSPVFI